MWWAATRTANSTATVALPAPLRSQNWVVAGGNPAGHVDPASRRAHRCQSHHSRAPDRASTDPAGRFNPVLRRVEQLTEVACPVALTRGERGIATAKTTDAAAARLGRDVFTTAVPDVGHHIGIGQPVALIAPSSAYS